MVEVCMHGLLNDFTKQFLKEQISGNITSLNKIYVSFDPNLDKNLEPTLREKELLIEVAKLPTGNYANGFYKTALTIDGNSVSLGTNQKSGYSIDVIDKVIKADAKTMTGQLTDSNGVILGLVYMNRLYLTFDPFSLTKDGKTYDEESARLKPITELVLKAINSYFEQNALTADAIEKYKVALFAKAYFADIDAQRKQLDREITEYESNVTEYSRRLGDSLSALKSKIIIRNGLSTINYDDQISVLQASFEKIRRNTKVQSVDFDTEGIKIVTTNIKCSGKNLGEYVIYFKKNNVTVKRLKTLNSYQHPHVSEAGTPCLGDFASVMQYLNDNQIDVAVEVMVAFLESYNPRSPHIKMSEFLTTIKED